MSDIDKPIWRSLEERVEGPQPEQRLNPLHNDFFSRREFMEWTSGMVAVLGASACTRMPAQKIIPYNKTPEQMVPGQPMFFATSSTLNGRAIGLLVESHMGRPTKVEGNPGHPASIGTTDAYAQASILSLYDADRSQSLLVGGLPVFWGGFVSQVSTLVKAHEGRRGDGIRILTETVVSPTLAWQIEEFLKRYPSAQWHQYEPVHRDQEREGALLAFGEDVATVYDFAKARIVVALDSDFLMEPACPRYARDFAEGRQMVGENQSMNRLYSVESTPSITGAKADNRLVARASEIETVAAALAQACGVAVQGRLELTEAQAKWAQAAAADLKANSGAGVVVVGRWQNAVVHALAHAINNRLRNAGETVHYTAPVEIESTSQGESIRKLGADMQAGKVETLVILGGNPVYNAPADAKFADGLRKVKNSIHCGLWLDETGSQCRFHVPEAHFLEQWSDARSYDGTVGIVQPLIAPLYGGKSHHEVVAALTGDANANGYDIVRSYWKSRASGDFENFWRKSLNDGFVAASAASRKRPGIRSESSWAKASRPTAADAIEVVLRPDPTVFDGRFANNGWLQELPKPLSKVTWDNAVYMSPATAAKLGVKSEMVVRVSRGDDSLEGPAWIQPGHADSSVTLHLGFGRTRGGSLGTGVGFNVYPWRRSTGPWHHGGFAIAKTDRVYHLACTQTHHSMKGREIVRSASLEHHKEHPHWTHKHEHLPKALEGKDVGTAGGSQAPVGLADYQWGMAINLSSCNGCNACVVACQAENNIPVVGKVEVARGREMQWIRLDRYYEGAENNPETHFQPVACVHCETAPCELVCPVGATVHDNEGLNNMVYNRCVGTKYCSNNCPYKARRFNFYEYTKTLTPTMKMVQNPDVTVRNRGVMEKCTYCVQRISQARIQAKNEGRKIRDGEVKTACQTACPSQAIFFGDVSDPNSLVSKMKAEPQNYGLLAELNTKPRTTYLGKVVNPNPALASEKPA